MLRDWYEEASVICEERQRDCGELSVGARDDHGSSATSNYWRRRKFVVASGSARHGRAVSAVAAATDGTSTAAAAAAAATDDVRRAERSRLKTSLSTAQDSAAFDAGVTQQTDAVTISPTRDLHPDTHSCEIKFSRSFQSTNYYCDNIVFII